MSSEMVVGRVAEVLVEHFWRDDYEGTWEGQMLFIKTAARAAIEAMRVPTEQMLTAGCNSMADMSPRQIEEGDTQALYTAMISAALEDSK